MQLGKIIPDAIYNENCLDTMARMPDNYIDLTVTSPPYDSIREYEGHTSAFNFEETAKSLYRVTKEGGMVIWIVADQTKDHDETGTSFRQALYFKEIGFKLLDTMIYQKPKSTRTYTPLRYADAFEYMFCLAKGRPKTAKPIRDQRRASAGLSHIKQRYGDTLTPKKAAPIHLWTQRTNVWYIKTGFTATTNDKFAYEHPAIFPDILAKDHILSWSNEGDLVYDPFCGSGTTLKMATLLQRRYIGSEINPSYIPIIHKRLEKVEPLTRITDY